MDSDLPATQSTLLHDSAGHFVEIKGCSWVRCIRWSNKVDALGPSTRRLNRCMTNFSIFCHGYLKSLRPLQTMGRRVRGRIATFYCCWKRMPGFAHLRFNYQTSLATCRLFRVLRWMERSDIHQPMSDGFRKALNPSCGLPLTPFSRTRGDFARRANVSQALALVTTGKSRAPFRASRARSEGRFAIVTKRWVRDAMDAPWCKDECARVRTTKPRGLSASTLARTRDNASRCAGTVTKSPIAGESAE